MRVVAVNTFVVAVDVGKTHLVGLAFVLIPTVDFRPEQRRGCSIVMDVDKAQFCVRFVG
jgi:hypothetical protein